MTQQQRHNLLWLASAMTHPYHYIRRRHFFDEQTQMFFTRVMLDYVGARFELRDTEDRRIGDSLAGDILVRLELIDDDSSSIVEIPKLNVDDKVAIQTLFLSHFEGVQYYKELHDAILGQQDEYEFVLDTLLSEHEGTAPMVPYWDNFKLKTVLEYISSFVDVIGFNLSM